MSNKLKITEEQLKRLMVLKEQHEGDAEEIEESAAGGVGLSLIPTKLEDMTASYIRQVKEILSQSPVHNGQFMYDQLLEQLSNGLTMGGNEDEYAVDELPSNRDVDMSTGELPSNRDMNMDTEYEINESILKIKSEFNRFL